MRKRNKNEREEKYNQDKKTTPGVFFFYSFLWCVSERKLVVLESDWYKGLREGRGGEGGGRERP